MEYRRLGRTGLEVSLVGLGTGGPSQLGQTRGTSRDEVRAFVRRALDLGINYFDTAPVYHDSEALLAHALDGVARDETVVATKYPSVVDVHADAPPLAPPSVIRPSVEAEPAATPAGRGGYRADSRPAAGALRRVPRAPGA